MIYISNFNIHIKSGKCSKCDNTIVIHRRHSGQFLCPSCFEKSIEKIIYKTISKYKMLDPQDKIIVGLSGGKDSTALLYNLIKIQEKSHNSEPLIAVTIDEGIKDYRDNAIKKAQAFCKKNNVEHHIISFKEKFGLSLDEIIVQKKDTSNYKYACNYCATIRRRLLNDSAKVLGGNVLAMGHNLTDLSETFLMNILYKRLNLIGSQYIFKQESELIRKYFIKKILPLMRIPEEEIFLYANIKKFEYYPSHCPYREKDPIIRKRVLDFIQECKKFSPEIEFNLLNGFLELSEILYNHYDKKRYHSCKQCGSLSSGTDLCTYCSLKKELKL